MNTSQTVYIRAALMALGLAVLFYFIAPATTSDLGLAAAAAALISGLLTPLVIRSTCCSSPASNNEAAPQKKAVTARKEEQTGTTPVGALTNITDAKTLYVGNLPYRANEAAIRKLFSQYGTVISVRLVKDKETGKRRGYGFVEMPEQEAMAAVAALNETEYLQRTLKVREANDKKESNDALENEA
ncbi:MAG: RNA recognition motif domain-containing protein [Aeromonadaceae bacterium]